MMLVTVVDHDDGPARHSFTVNYDPSNSALDTRILDPNYIGRGAMS